MDHVNPFRYGGVIDDAGFCNRKQEIDDLLRAARNGERRFVYAERRMGKTSLMLNVLGRLSPRRYLGVYVDLWPTDGTESFVTTLARALATAAETRTDKLLETSRELFTRLSPSLTLDDAGNPTLQFGANRLSDPTPELEEVLAAPPRIAERRQRTVVVVMDEFQQVAAYGDDRVERALRSAVQQQQGVAYFFLGSRKHLVEGLFSDAGRPLYRSAGHYPIGPIELKHWSPFVRDRFESTGKTISESIVGSLCACTEGHPYYTQHLAHALWERTPPGRSVGEGDLAGALDLVMQRESYAFVALWEGLSSNQQRVLRGVAQAPVGVTPYSAEFAQSFGLRGASVVQRGLTSLLARDLIDREGGSFIIPDRFLKLWIRRL